MVTFSRIRSEIELFFFLAAKQGEAENNNIGKSNSNFI